MMSLLSWFQFERVISCDALYVFYFEVLFLCVLSSQSVLIFFHLFTVGWSYLWANCFKSFYGKMTSPAPSTTFIFDVQTQKGVWSSHPMFS